MKISKYIAILAAFAVATVASAQTAPSASNANGKAPSAVAKGKSKKPKVSQSMKDGVLSIAVQMDVSDPFVSVSDALKEIMLAVTEITGKDTMSSKPVEASMGSILAAVKDKNHPAKGNIDVNIDVKTRFEDGKPVMNAVTEVAIAGEKYAGETKTVVAADGTTSTQGNVVVTDASGVASTVPVQVAVDAQGNVSGTAGEASVATQTPQAEAAAQIVDTNVASADVTPLPDNTVVTSQD